MSQKDSDANRMVDGNNDGMVQPPPPSYTANASAKYAPPTGPPPGGNAYYQAQPVGGQQYAPPNGAYIPPSTAYGAPGGGNPTTVVYVADDGNGVPPGALRSGGIPMAMLCFIFGLCTWIGYLMGMCYLKSKDPRERFWARACAIMAVVWAIIVVFATIFGRNNNNNYNRGRNGNYYNGGYP